MEKTFLQDVVETLQKQGRPISDFVFLLPSKRAGLFLKEVLKTKYYNDILFVPVILSIEEFITELSGLHAIDSTTALFEFYHTYLHTHTDLEKESFESFTTWAQTLLHDFNEIDRYLIDHQSFFNYLSRIQDLNHWYLQPEKTPLVQRYITFWKNLESYYANFVIRLTDMGKGYQGLQYRVASENIVSHAAKIDHQYIFVGFNALNEAEQKIIQYLLGEQKAQIFWDMDTVFYEDKGHDASLFLRRYVKDWNYFEQEKPQWITSHFSKTKNIQIIGTPKHIGQAKYIGEILADIPKENLQRTAVVLGDETLLLPVLNSLPAHVNDLNITMGLPLREVPLASFFELLLKLHSQTEARGYHYKLVLELLHSQSAYWLLGSTINQLSAMITNENLVYLDITHLRVVTPDSQHHILKVLFDPIEKVDEAIVRFQELVHLLKEVLTVQNKTLDLEYCYRFYLVFNQLKLLQEHYSYITNLPALQKLYHDLLRNETLDFRGEPFRGLQLMGMLESRCLDFETVIITAVNEGVLPAGKSANSFIPYDLKKAYELPTYKEKDAIYTYHFYRLLQRAKNIYLIYNTEADGLNTGEKSRFLLQLEMEKQQQHQLHKFMVSPKVPQIISEPLRYSKNETVVQKLTTFATHGFSPSALTSYMRNPIDFYYRYILGIHDEDTVEETIAANTLGTVVHNVLENFYAPLIGKEIQVSDIKNMISAIAEEVQKEFRAVYAKMNITQGKNLIIYEVAKRYILNFLKLEQRLLNSGATLKIIAIESNLKAAIAIPELDFPVHIKGKVDRIDELNGQLRIIDYKTGKVSKNELAVSDWSLMTTDYKYSKVLQVLTYAYMLYENHPYDGAAEGGVISFKNLKEGFLKFGIKTGTGRTLEHAITPEVLEKYLLELKTLILEICNPNIPFIEKEL